MPASGSCIPKTTASAGTTHRRDAASDAHTAACERLTPMASERDRVVVHSRELIETSRDLVRLARRNIEATSVRIEHARNLGTARTSGGIRFLLAPVLRTLDRLPRL